MALESATYISDLNTSNPTATDVISEADDHLRLVKAAIKATFPNISGAVNSTHTELNLLDGLASTDIVMPSGSIIVYAGSSAPTGYLFCDGSAISRSTYATLFGIISTTYGVGDGSSTFILPDIRGRVVAGKEASASLLTSALGGLDGNTIGNTGGNQAITLTAAQSGVKMPKGIGTDDIENVNLRVDKEFDVDNVKSAKDNFEDLAKRNGNPWHAFHNHKTDELQIINQQEWNQKGNGEFVDIFEDGVTLNKSEVNSWKQALKTGKLGNFPIKKAAYLLKELNKNPGMKILKGTALAGIPALLDVVEAKDGFTELLNEEFTARDKALAGLKAYAATAGIATLTPAAPLAIPTSIATGLLHSGIKMMDAQKIKKRNELMMSLGLEMLPNGEIRDRQYNPVNVDLETGEVIPHQLGQGHVKKQTRRGSR